MFRVRKNSIKKWKTLLLVWKVARPWSGGRNWPGNIRELQNVIERGVITYVGETLRIDLVSLTTPTTHLVTGADPVANDGIMTEDEFDSLAVEEKLELIREAFEWTFQPDPRWA